MCVCVCVCVCVCEFIKPLQCCDSCTRYLYWSDWGIAPRIERMSMDGTMRETLHNTSLQWPNGIAIDYSSQVLYWVDAKLDKIESSFTNGSNRRLLSTALIFHPFSMSFFQGVLYWSDWHVHQVLYAPVESLSSVVGLTPPLKTDPLGIKIISMNAQPISECVCVCVVGFPLPCLLNKVLPLPPPPLTF